MKNHFKIYISFLILFGLTSCSKLLEEVPKSQVNKDQFYQNEAQCIAGLNGCYDNLTDIFTHNLFKINEGSSDLAFWALDDADASFAISPANPGVGDIIWTAAYHGVMVCNATIVGINKSPVAEARKKSLVAEAVTLRALYYFVLTSMFGDVPFYTKEVANFDDLEGITKLGRMSASDTRNFLINDLAEYAPSLPQIKTSLIAGNRVSASLAYILIAKMAMWEKKYDVALPALQKIMGIYGSLHSYKLEDILFRNKNIEESILEVQFAWSATGIRKTTLVAAITTPPRTANTSIYDGVEILELGDKANPSTSITPSDYLIDIFNKYPNDLREKIVMARDYNDKWFNRPSRDNFEGKPWMGPKFWAIQMDNKLDGNNQKVFRYADALLMAAECYNEIGNEAEALRYINMTKIRANIPILETYPGKQAFFEELMDERGRELMGEYGRKWDLVRWGIFYDRINNTIATENEKIKANLRPYHEYYPIPDEEVFRSKGVLTNDAYKQ